MTHKAEEPHFYPFTKEAGWLFHNTVGHTVTGVIQFVGYGFHLVGLSSVGTRALKLAESFHDLTTPKRDYPRFS